VIVETGAGNGSYIDDAAYLASGAKVAPDAATVYRQADLVVKVQAPTPAEVSLLPPGSVIISFLDRSRDTDVIQQMADRGVTAFSFNAVPRVTRAQSMDAMSSMSTVAGYKVALLAANALGRLFPLLMTAAGTVTPARVLVIGVGVAGLQALATARRLGAVTEAFDTRPAAQEQAQSVGATLVDAPLPLEGTEGQGGYAREMEEEFLVRERDALRTPVARADVVITTALVPGKPAPLLIDEEMVAAMRPGSVIVDMAAEAGGNCAVTVPGDTVVSHNVTVLAPLNIPSMVPVHASQMYSRNVAAVIGHIVKDGVLTLDADDEITGAACLTGVHPARTSLGR
jgi:NAD(P) transhydrogenase subunit alpha